MNVAIAPIWGAHSDRVRTARFCDSNSVRGTTLEHHRNQAAESTPPDCCCVLVVLLPLLDEQFHDLGLHGYKEPGSLRTQRVLVMERG